MQEYRVIIEKSRSGFSAYSPDVLGCIAAANTRQRVKRLMKKALKLHVQMMEDSGYSRPTSTDRSYIA